MFWFYQLNDTTRGKAHWGWSKLQIQIAQSSLESFSIKANDNGEARTWNFSRVEDFSYKSTDIIHNLVWRYDSWSVLMHWIRNGSMSVSIIFAGVWRSDSWQATACSHEGLQQVVSQKYKYKFMIIHIQSQIQILKASNQIKKQLQEIRTSSYKWERIHEISVACQTMNSMQFSWIW